MYSLNISLHACCFLTLSANSLRVNISCVESAKLPKTSVIVNQFFCGCELCCSQAWVGGLEIINKKPKSLQPENRIYPEIWQKGCLPHFVFNSMNNILSFFYGPCVSIKLHKLMCDWILSCNRCQAEGSQRIVLTTSFFLRIYHYCKMDLWILEAAQLLVLYLPHMACVFGNPVIV